MTHHGMMAFNGLPHFCTIAEDQNLIAGNFGRLFTSLHLIHPHPSAVSIQPLRRRIYAPQILIWTAFMATAPKPHLSYTTKAVHLAA